MAPQDHFRLLIDKLGLNRHADLLLSALGPSVSLSAEDRTATPGDSKLGGRPDLPMDALWPKRLGYPLAFLGQVRLSQMPVEVLQHWSLAQRGRLWFWYDTATEPWGFDPADKGAFQVTFVADESPVEPRGWPAFPPGAIKGEPHWPFEPFKECALSADPGLAIDYEVLAPLLENEWDALETLRTHFQGEQGKGIHRLLGHPDEVQGHMRRECQLVSNGIYLGEPIAPKDQARADALAPGAKDWTLLLQIDTDENGPGWMWGDVGCLYFWVRREEMKANDFSGVWGVLQCG
jgi:uncharacterized protein YwqG